MAIELNETQMRELIESATNAEASMRLMRQAIIAIRAQCEDRFICAELDAATIFAWDALKLVMAHARKVGEIAEGKTDDTEMMH